NGNHEETKPFGQYQVRSHRALPSLPAPNCLNELPGNRNAKSKYFAEEDTRSSPFLAPPWRRSFQPSTPECRVVLQPGLRVFQDVVSGRGPIQDLSGLLAGETLVDRQAHAAASGVRLHPSAS